MGETQQSIETWEDMLECVGEDLGSLTGADAMTKEWIRRWNECFEVDCPMYYDKQAAQEAGYRDIPTPGCLVFAAATPPYWQPGDPCGRTEPVSIDVPSMRVRKPPMSNVGFGTDIEAEFFAPVYPGDRITQVGRLEKVTRKKIKVADGVFYTVAVDFINQHNELVGRMYITSFSGEKITQ